LGRLYGGPAAAGFLPQIIPLVRTDRDRQDPARCAQAVQLAHLARRASSPDGLQRWDRLLARLEKHEQAAWQLIQQRRRQEAAARAGQKIAVLSVKASDEDSPRGWIAAKAIDGNVDEPGGYWLTKKSHPRQAWLELTLARLAKISRVVLFHQLNPGHYRSLDYSISARIDGKWQSLVSVKDNQQAGWVAHQFPEVLTSAVRLEITRSAYGDRMGVGEIELRCAAPSN
jgi:hypothetical protein